MNHLNMWICLPHTITIWSWHCAHFPWARLLSRGELVNVPVATGCIFTYFEEPTLKVPCPTFLPWLLTTTQGNPTASDHAQPSHQSQLHNLESLSAMKKSSLVQIKTSISHQSQSPPIPVAQNLLCERWGWLFLSPLLAPHSLTESHMHTMEATVEDKGASLGSFGDGLFPVFKEKN